LSGAAAKPFEILPAATGPKMLHWRKTKTDEAWVDLAIMSDADWVADVKRTTGVVAKLSVG
jgi:hypothetical protein